MLFFEKPHGKIKRKISWVVEELGKNVRKALCWEEVLLGELWRGKLSYPRVGSNSFLVSIRITQ